MRLSPAIYVSCLRWKQGEYMAVRQLSQIARAHFMPLIEVAEIGYDFEKQSEVHSIDDHLRLFAKRLEANWGSSECFVDLHLVANERCSSGRPHPIAHAFDDLRKRKILAIPVTGFDRDSQYRDAIKKVVEVDGRGLCLRVDVNRLVGSNKVSPTRELRESYHMEVGDCDLIIDLGAPNFEPVDAFANLLVRIIGSISELSAWRSFTLMGTSVPETTAGLSLPLSRAPRGEWRLYKVLEQRLLASRGRLPCFGDYAINSPAVLSLDMRKVKPNAAIRYSTDDDWLVAKGRNVRDKAYGGYGQFRNLCRLIVGSGDYCGRDFSFGDKYISDCARGKAATGNLTTWRWVGTNHHIEKVTADLATLRGS